MTDERLKRFYYQLRRRKVLKVAIAYAALAWAILQVADVVFPAMLLPDWSVRLAVILLILGFPLAVVLTWIFDITPRGIERTPDILDADDSATAARAPSAALEPPAIDESIASVAVLPFDDLSPQGGQDLLGVGIATEIHSTLRKLHRIRLAPRRSAFRLAHEQMAVEDIAHTLNVRYVLSGTLTLHDGRLRVIAELDDGIEGSQIWSKKYERDLADLLLLQADIAESVVAAFGGERQRLEIQRAQTASTGNLDAWSLVQKARNYILDYSRQSLDEAQALLLNGVALDPDYAAAHAALGSVLAESVLNGFSDNPDSDHERAVAAIRRAELLAPHDVFVLKMAGMVWAICGDPDRSIRALRACVEIAPFDFGAWGYLGWPLVARGTADDLKEVQRVMNRLLRLAPEHPGVPYWLFHKSVAHACQGDFEGAIEFGDQAIGKDGGQSWIWMHHANVKGLLGEPEEARRDALHAAELNSAMTPRHYAARVRAMRGSPETERKRLEGLIRAGLLSA